MSKEDLLEIMVGIALVAFIFWWLVRMPAPSYMPEYGSSPQEIPYQMKD